MSEKEKINELNEMEIDSSNIEEILESEDLGGLDTTIDAISEIALSEKSALKEGEGSFERRNRADDFRKKRRFDNNKSFNNNEKLEYVSISVRPVSKTRAGGRIRSFSVLLVGMSNVAGKIFIGHGTGKSLDVSKAMQKAEAQVLKNLVRVPIRKNTIIYNTQYKHCGTTVILKKALPGSGLKAGGVARKILSLAGFSDISCKCIGNSMSPHNVIYAIMECFKNMVSVYDIATGRGKTLGEILQIQKANLRKAGGLRYE
jgi:small subunit ribosomal protein S5